MNLSIAAVFIAIISIQIGASVAKEMFPQFGALGTTALRISFAALILMLFFRPWKIKLTQKFKKQVFYFGLSLAFMNMCFYKALELIPQGIAVALEFTGPLVLSTLLSKNKKDFLWVILAALGLLLTLPRNLDQESLSLLGIFYALAAGFFWALYIVIGKKVGTDQGTSSIAWAMLVAAIVTLPFGVYEQGLKLFTVDMIPLALAVAMLSSVIPYTCELFALKKIPAKTFGILLSLEPAIAVLSGFLFLKEYMTGLQLLAIALISSASLGSTLSAKKKSIVNTLLDT